MSSSTPGPMAGAPGTDDIDLATSVAGEEDPGASNEVGSAVKSSPGRSDQPAGRRGDEPTTAQRPMAPGDEAPPGTPSTGENVCPECGGSGKLGASACPNCEGTGTVTVGIGGA